MKKKWYEEGQFFTHYYVRGDNSLEGFTKIHRNLEQRTIREVKGVVYLTGIKKGKILDLPCGYGRHSIEFAKRGFDVMGIDLSLQFLELAESRAKNEGVSVNFKKGDMRTLESELHNRFDILTNLSYSFGFFEDEENLETMNNFYHALKRDGKIVIHTDICPEMLYNSYALKEIRAISSKNGNYNAKLKINEWYDEVTKRMHGIWTIIEDCQEITLPEYDVRIYSPKEFYKICSDIGFKNIQLIGDWKEKFNPAKHQELIIIAEK